MEIYCDGVPVNGSVIVDGQTVNFDKPELASVLQCSEENNWTGPNQKGYGVRSSMACEDEYFGLAGLDGGE